MEITEMISSLGFPIVCVIGLALYVNKETTNAKNQFQTIYQESRIDAKEREEHYQQHQKEMVHEMGKISATIDRINDRLEDIEKKVFTNPLIKKGD